MSPVVKYLLSVGIPYFIRVVLYSGVFKLRGISCSIVGRFVIGGAFILVGLFPLPQLFQFLLMIAASWFLVSKYTDTGFPDILYISLGVEITTILVVELLIVPWLF
jgi:hypothetical protein